MAHLNQGALLLSRCKGKTPQDKHSAKLPKEGSQRKELVEGLGFRVCSKWCLGVGSP